MKKSTKGILDSILYAIVFVLIQLFVQLAVALIYNQFENVGYANVVNGMASGIYGEALAISTVLSSSLTFLLFIRLKWFPFSLSYLKTRPWAVIIWTVLLSFGLILPSEWIMEKLQLTMDPTYTKIFESVMKEPWGFIAIGVLAPLAEEVVFRGAILNALLKIFPKKYYWVSILVSALMFGAVHGNLVQFVFAFSVGILLGWMYYRTNSIIPGVVLHWINNSVAYVMFNLMPKMQDGKLIDLFHGSEKMMVEGLLFSLCVFIPSLFQLATRMKSADQL